MVQTMRINKGSLQGRRRGHNLEKKEKASPGIIHTPLSSLLFPGPDGPAKQPYVEWPSTW